jgi:hypothetical protein
MKLELDNSENVFVSELEKLSKNDLSKIKKQFKDESNEGLAKQNSDLNKELNQQLEMVVSELNVIKKEREEKAARQ